jgi:Pex19 protein family
MAVFRRPNWQSTYSKCEQDTLGSRFSYAQRSLLLHHHSLAPHTRARLYRRQKQCDCFQRLVRVYETEPNNVAKLMDLMQQVQEYGQPPVEIIQAIAPGLELDDNGLPKLDGDTMGSGGFAGFPPFGDGTGGTDECIVM